MGDLDKDEFARVCRIEANEFQWLNFREQGFVRTAECLKKSSSRWEPASPCDVCVAVSKDSIFRNALSRKLPKDENLKFTPHGHRAKLAGDRYAKMVGVYDIVRKASDVSCSLFNFLRNSQDCDSYRMALTHSCISSSECFEGTTKEKHFPLYLRLSQSRWIRNAAVSECRTFTTFLH